MLLEYFLHRTVSNPYDIRFHTYRYHVREFAGMTSQGANWANTEGESASTVVRNLRWSFPQIKPDSRSKHDFAVIREVEYFNLAS